MNFTLGLLLGVYFFFIRSMGRRCTVSAKGRPDGRRGRRPEAAGEPAVRPVNAPVFTLERRRAARPLKAAPRRRDAPRRSAAADGQLLCADLSAAPRPAPLTAPAGNAGRG